MYGEIETRWQKSKSMGILTDIKAHRHLADFVAKTAHRRMAAKGRADVEEEIGEDQDDMKNLI